MGIDVHDVTAGVVDEELLCSICTDIVQQPRCCRSGHVFCEECIKTWLHNNGTCPIGREDLEVEQLAHVRPLERMVDRIQVRCPNRGAGRSWTCRPFGCTWTGVVADRAAHLNNECTFQPVPCTLPGCDASVPRRRLAAHMNTCPRRESAASPGKCQLPPKPTARAAGSANAHAEVQAQRWVASWLFVTAGLLIVAAILFNPLAPDRTVRTLEKERPSEAAAPARAGKDSHGSEHVIGDEIHRTAADGSDPGDTDSRLTAQKGTDDDLHGGGHAPDDEVPLSAVDGNEPGGTDSNAPRAAGGGIEISFDTATATPQTIVSAMRGLVTNADVQESGCLALWSLAYRNGATSAEIVRAGGVDAVIAAMQTHVRLSPSNWRVQELCTAALWNMAIDGWWREGAPPTAGDLPGVAPPVGAASTCLAIVEAGGLEAVIQAMNAHATQHAVVRLHARLDVPTDRVEESLAHTYADTFSSTLALIDNEVHVVETAFVYALKIAGVVLRRWSRASGFWDFLLRIPTTGSCSLALVELTLYCRRLLSSRILLRFWRQPTVHCGSSRLTIRTGP